MTTNSDLFYDILMSEEISQQDGFEQGRLVGKDQGQAEGNKLGWETGAAIGSEVGFYAGFAKSLLEEMADSDDKPRLMKTLEKVASAAEDFSYCNAQDPKMLNDQTEIKAKFKQVCSQLGIKLETSGSSNSSGVSF